MGGVRQTLSVLVVEDDREIRELLCEILRGEGYWAIAADDGEAAVRRARLTPPDIVLLDLMLPGMDGCAVMADMRTRCQPAVIILSAAADLQTQAERIGAVSGVLGKPFDIGRLLALLRDATTAPAVPPAA